MLLLVTIGLVVVGAIALVIGFVSNSLGPIYLSIACSVIAGIVLVVFSRMARRSDSSSAAPATTSPGSWSPSTTSAPPPPPAPARTPAFERAPEPAAAPAAAPPPPPPSLRREPEPTITLDEPVSAPARSAAAFDGDDDFPIPGYDSMRSSQIVAMLGDLDLDDLDMVQEREEQGKNRATVLRRVVERIDQLEAEETVDAPLVEEPMPLARDDDDFAAATDGAFTAAPAGSVADDDGFPIADYDELSADEIIAVLDDLEDDELDMVAAREERGRNRVEILEYIDDMFEEVDDGAEPAAPVVPPSPPPRTPAKKAPAKKVTAVKKAPVKKVAAKVVATAPKKAPARPAGATKAAPRKAAAKTPSATRAVSPGTKGAGRKAGAPVVKVAKAPAKAPAKTAATRATAKKVPAKKVAAPARKR